MKKIWAVATTMMLLGSAVLAQSTSGDKNKKTPTETKAAQKTEAKTGAAQQANPNPTKKPTEKTALNPQPLPPGPQSAGQKSSTASKVALNPQPLPPGAKKGPTSPESKVALNPQPLPPKAQTASQKKGATAKANKKTSGGPGPSGNSTPK